MPTVIPLDRANQLVVIFIFTTGALLPICLALLVSRIAAWRTLKDARQVIKSITENYVACSRNYDLVRDDLERERSRRTDDVRTATEALRIANGIIDELRARLGERPGGDEPSEPKRPTSARTRRSGVLHPDWMAGEQEAPLVIPGKRQ